MDAKHRDGEVDLDPLHGGAPLGFRSSLVWSERGGGVFCIASVVNVEDVVPRRDKSPGGPQAPGVPALPGFTEGIR